MTSDLEVAFRLADRADAATMRSWSSTGVLSSLKDDGTPVTVADLAAERAILEELRKFEIGDGVLGEEIGEHPSSTKRRWIIDGIDWTRSYAAGRTTWGTLIALEDHGEIVLGLSSSPAQDRRWWAIRGRGAFAGCSDGSSASRIGVSTRYAEIKPDRIATLPEHLALNDGHQQIVLELAGGPSTNWAWSHQNRVAEGEIDVCIWFAGDIWDHAAPSIIVEEAGGRFTDHFGTKRLDTRTALYTNGLHHDQILATIQAQAAT